MHFKIFRPFVRQREGRILELKALAKGMLDRANQEQRTEDAKQIEGILAEAKVQPGDGELGWGSILEMEHRLLNFAPEIGLRESIIMQMDELQDILPGDSFDDLRVWVRGSLAGTSRNQSRAALLDVARTLLYRRKAIYTRIIAQESAKRNLTIYLMVALMLVAWMAIHNISICYQHEIRGALFAFVVGFGVLGSVVSLIQRLNGESIKDYDEVNSIRLRFGWVTFLILPAVGGAFALLLLTLLMSKLVAGELFPTILPNGQTDYSRLAVWSFLAGFAERLVPDMLNRLVARSSKPTGLWPRDHRSDVDQSGARSSDESGTKDASPEPA